MSSPDRRAFLADALASAPEAPLVVVLPVRATAPLDVLRRVRRGDAWLLSREASEHDGAECVLGLGASRRALLGRDAADTISAWHASAPPWALRAHPAAAVALAARLPLSLFGHAFEPGANERGGPIEEPWSAHGDGVIVVPRWTYLEADGQAVLAWTSMDRWAGQSSVVLGELEALLSALESPTPVARVTPPRVGARVERTSSAAWADRVEAARSAIASGELEKVVVSRRALVSTAYDLAAEDVLGPLSPRGTLRYLVRLGGASLLGATPERLFRKRGRRISTEALAGTCPQGSAEVEEALLASAKDLSEHAPVISAIEASLRALGADVRVEARPRLARVANLVHLRTLLEGELGEEASADAARVLGALHPTPATGGWPRDVARAFIRAHEPARGWYAGPLGWIDARGDADVHVMLRCAVLRGARAWVFAGGGIVATSNARAEWAETELKMAPLLAALGLEAEDPRAWSLAAGSGHGSPEASPGVPASHASPAEAAP